MPGNKLEIAWIIGVNKKIVGVVEGKIFTVPLWLADRLVYGNLEGFIPQV